MTTKTTEQQTLKDIAAGKYRDAYLVYARKSTDEPDNQKNSIAFQKAEGSRFTRREHLPVAQVTLRGFCTDGVVSERHSAFREAGDLDFGDNGSVRYRVERPKFHRLASFLAKRYFKGVVFLCWDRASRNKGDELIIRKLMKAGVDVRFVLATYDDTSSGELHKDIDGMFAEHHSRVTREKVKGTIAKSREQGLCTHKAPVGYLNTGSMEHKPLDPERAQLIRELFEKADQTAWSLSDLRRWAIQQGFTMLPSRRKRTAEEQLEDEERDERRETELVARLPTVTVIHQILTNPFYTGRVRGNGGQWVKGTSHEALVSDALFARVQEKLTRRRTSIRYPKKLELPYRGLLRCACGRVYTPYVQKGIVYFGARCDRSCSNSRKSVNLAFVENTISKVLDGLVLTDEELEKLERAASTLAAGLETKQAKEHDPIARRARKLREDLAYVAENRITLLRTGAYTPETLTADEARLARELEKLEAKPATSPREVRGVTAALATLSELLEMAQAQYEIAKTPGRERLARMILSELSLHETGVNFQCVSRLRPLERRIFSSSALNEWLSELALHQAEIKVATDDIRAALGEAET